MAGAAGSSVEPKSPAGLPRQSWVTRVVRLTRKELRETLRDRRTIVTLVLMPLLLYPLISLVFQQFMLLNAGSGEDFRWNVGVRREQDFARLIRVLQLGESYLKSRGELTKQDGPAPPATGDAVAAPNLLQPALREPSLETINPQFDDNLSNLNRMLEQGDVDVIAIINELDDETDENDQGRLGIELSFVPTSSYGRELSKYMDRRVRAANEALLYRDLVGRGGKGEPRLTSTLKRKEVQDESIQIASLIPLILILMTMTGAVYPAIDLTAGERERGTLEALMAAPVPRLGLLIAKYLAVLCVALLTAVVNLTAMTITLKASGLGKVLLGPQGLPVSTILAVLGLLLLFAAFFSAVMLTVTSFAKSFKEAQAYLIPLVLLALAPGFLSLLPGLKLEGILAITPLANIVLLSRDLLQHRAEPIAAATAVITTALYAIAALALAAKIFGSDAVLYGSQGSWSELLRRPAEPQPAPTFAQGMTAVAVLYPCFFLAQGLLGQFREASLTQQHLLNGLGLLVVFLCLPLAITWWTNRRFTTTLQLSPPSPLAIVGAALLGLSLWPFAHELFLLAQQLGFSTMSPDLMRELIDRFAERVEERHAVPFGVVLFAVAIAPAVAEEIFFRGYLQTALQQKLPAWGAILITAAVFGVFHISVGGLVILERVLSSAALGLLLGWLCWQTRSIWPGILLHSFHNGAVLVLDRFKQPIQDLPFIKQLGWNQENVSHLPGMLLGIAGVVAVAGIGLVLLGSRSRLLPLDSYARDEVQGS